MIIQLEAEILMEKNKWMVDVLLDIAAHAEAKGMTRSFEALLDAMMITSAELQNPEQSKFSGHERLTNVVPIIRISGCRNRTN